MMNAVRLLSSRASLFQSPSLASSPSLSVLSQPRHFTSNSNRRALQSLATPTLSLTHTPRPQWSAGDLSPIALPQRLSSSSASLPNESKSRQEEQGSDGSPPPPPSKKKKKQLSPFLLALVGVALALLVAYRKEAKLTGDMALRFFRSFFVGLRLAYDYKMSFRGLDPDDPENLQVWHNFHEAAAYQMLALFRKQGGVYVKLGQHLASLPHVLPSEYCNAMASLHDDAQYRDFSEIVDVFQEEFGKHPDEIFDVIDRSPVAAASLAQVHRAEKDGQEYAVKVQFLDLREMAAADVKTIEFMCFGITSLFPQFRLQWLVREFNLNLPNELDFMNDARNATKLRDLFQGDTDVTTPVHSPALSCPRILCMEFVRGIKVDDTPRLLAHGYSPVHVATMINRVFNDQIFKHGFVHCDPHPGNILIRPHPEDPKKPQIVLLDNGLYREYSPEFRVKWAHMWKSILEMDEDNIKRYAQEVGLSKGENHRLLTSMLTARPWDRLNSDVTHSFKEFDDAEKAHIKTQMSLRAPEITQLLQSVDSAVILLLKTNDLLRNLNLLLGAHPLRAFNSMMRACINSIHEDRIRSNPPLVQRARFEWERWVSYLKIFLLDVYVTMGQARALLW